MAGLYHGLVWVWDLWAVRSAYGDARVRLNDHLVEDYRNYLF